MKNVRWSDNVCTVGGTCIHGYFTTEDLRQLFKLCPRGSFTPTFFESELGPAGYTEEDIVILENLDKKRPNEKTYSFSKWEHGFYFTFMETDGQQLLDYLKERFPMIRGE